jgi:hypothetical protein
MKNQRRVQPRELLEMLDLEERILLAGQLGLTPPENLNDSTFLGRISQFSATTLLSAIVRLRRPFIQMLQEIYQFMAREKARGRTTTRAVVLPSAQGDLQIVFDQSLQQAIATVLNSRIGSVSIDSLEQHAGELSRLVADYMRGIRGSPIRRETYLSHQMRCIPNPAMQIMARRMDTHSFVYHPKDIERVEGLYNDLKDIVDTFRRVSFELTQRDYLIPIDTNTVLRHLKDAINAVKYKVWDMEAHQPSPHDIDSPHESIDENKWEDLLEKIRIVKEEIFAACDFQSSAASICDFLNLELWRERWRVYELWILTHLLQLFQNLGFEVDISSRVTDGIWNLKFTKDTRPVALLYGGTENLEVYYQLYAKGTNKGDMPDIALKKDGEFLVILDAKHGTSYDRVVLADLAKRYAKAFSSKLTIIHNFYPMTYTYEVVLENPRCLIISNVAPNTEEVTKLDREIISILQSWLPQGESIVILVDVSGSTLPIRDRMTKAIKRVLSNSRRRALPGSIIMFFSDRLVKEIPLSDLRNIDDIDKVLSNSFGGGTNLASALETAVKKLTSMRAPRSLLFFTDGQDSFDIVAMSERISSAGLRLWIYEAVDSDNKTPLQELAQISGGSYERI